MPDLTKALVVELTNPHSHAAKYSRNPSQKNGGHHISKGGIIWSEMLKTAHMGVVIRCPQSLAHILYLPVDLHFAHFAQMCIPPPLFSLLVGGLKMGCYSADYPKGMLRQGKGV